MPTLPSTKFIEAVNKNGVKQIIPRVWMEDGSPFAGQFRLTRRADKAAEDKATKQESTDSDQAAAQADTTTTPARRGRTNKE